VSALRIEIVSDPVCPWCYIGKRRLDAALARHPDVTAELQWTPFQLAPDMPREGRDRAEHYASIFGEERAATIRDSMAQTARDEGLEFQWLDGARSPNTLRAHVVMALAADTPECDPSALAEVLFHAHHVDCADLGDPDVLLRLAQSVGLDGGQVRAALDDPGFEAQVRDKIGQAAARGVNGVPFFIFNERYAVSGAQPADALAEVIGRLTGAG
jgi:predicted DsbA family dithiol-disulfide isomerase